MPHEISRSDEFGGRRLGRDHLAFYRAWLQGVDLREAAKRYLGDDIDLRATRSTLRWIRDAVTLAARRHGRFGEIRLLRLPLVDKSAREGEPGSPALALPTLEQYREQVDPGGVYSERELAERYVESYPEAQSPKTRQRQRLLDRQLAALVWVESLLVTAPRPEDSVAAWFEPPLAARLIIHQVYTIGALHQCASERHRWWGKIRGLGKQGGERLVRWLVSHEDTLGRLKPESLVPLRAVRTMRATPGWEIQKSAALVPFEVFAPPSDLDGSSGTNRLPGRCRLNAPNDYAAIEAWLATQRNPNTARAYRREAERLLLWAVLERQRALSSLAIEDVTDYFGWLASLQCTDPQAWPWNIPRERWVGDRHAPRWSSQWRPFDGPLTLRSRQQAFRILKVLFDWLVGARYLDGNPLRAVAEPKAQIGDGERLPEVEVSHALSRAQMAFLVKHLDSLPPGEATSRLRFVVLFAYGTGLRSAELADARFGRLYQKPLKSGLGVRWMLNVLGKGGKQRSVPMPQAVMQVLRQYLADRGLDPEPAKQPESAPLIARAGGRSADAPLTPSMIYKLLGKLFKSAAQELERLGHPEDAAKLQKASTHWLRHTRGTHSAEAAMSVPMLQKLLGHASPTTTALYISPDEEMLYLTLDGELGATPGNLPFHIMSRQNANS